MKSGERRPGCTGGTSLLYFTSFYQYDTYLQLFSFVFLYFSLEKIKNGLFLILESIICSLYYNKPKQAHFLDIFQKKL